MYKLGLAAFLVTMEYVLARMTNLDMTRFLAWHTSNLASYEGVVIRLLSGFLVVEHLFGRRITKQSCLQKWGIVPPHSQHLLPTSNCSY
jgi:hypothetical protein